MPAASSLSSVTDSRSNQVDNSSYAPSSMPPPNTFDFLPPLHVLLSRLLRPDQWTYSKMEGLDPKDLLTEAASLRIKIQKAKMAVQDFPEADLTVEQQEEELRALRDNIKKQQQMIVDIGHRAAESIASIKANNSS